MKPKHPTSSQQPTASALLLLRLLSPGLARPRPARPHAGSSSGGSFLGFGAHEDFKVLQEAGREAAAAQCGTPCTILRVSLGLPA